MATTEFPGIGEGDDVDGGDYRNRERVATCGSNGIWATGLDNGRWKAR